MAIDDFCNISYPHPSMTLSVGLWHMSAGTGQKGASACLEVYR